MGKKGLNSAPLDGVIHISVSHSTVPMVDGGFEALTVDEVTSLGSSVVQ